MSLGEQAARLCFCPLDLYERLCPSGADGLGFIVGLSSVEM